MFGPLTICNDPGRIPHESSPNRAQTPPIITTRPRFARAFLTRTTEVGE